MQPPKVPLGVSGKARFTVEPCCHEQHAWWVVAEAHFLSTWDTEEAAHAEVDRLFETGSTIAQASR